MAAANILARWTYFYGDVSMSYLKCLDLANSIINQLIVILIVNSFDKFKPEGSLCPVLLACIAYFMMYDQSVMTSMVPTNIISLEVRNTTKTASSIDSHAETNDPSDILNHWGGIIRADFEQNNPDFQPLINAINITQVLVAINHIGTEFSSLHRDSIELNRCVQHISKLVEMDILVSEI